ncbi:hypothetical protein [Chakrabartyella piscis]|uniref:hypothetical protein n=1 Tax=Chakrabartyella piscis TaxID=2918914 RepID=UPI003A7F2E3E
MVWSVEYIIWSIQSGGKSVGLKIPLVYSQLPLLIGFILMLFYSVVDFIKLIKKAPQVELEEVGESEWN